MASRHSSSDNIDSLIVECRKHFSLERYARAQQICRTVLDEEPAHRVALYLSALCELYQGRLQEAAAALSTLIERHPDHVNGLVLLSKVCLGLGRYSQSTGYARKALELEIQDDRVLSLLAGILGESEDHESARIAYERAIRINPDSASHLCDYASILRIKGRIDEAVDTLERSIELDGGHCKAHWMLSSLKRQTKDDNHIPRLARREADADASQKDRMLLNFALAKEYEDIGEYERSFHHLSQACDLKRKSIRYDVEAEIGQFRHLEEAVDSAYVRRMSGGGYTDYAPIFILGLPRTGSTLIEQILGAHEQLFAAGELPTFGNEVARLFRGDADQSLDLSSVESGEVDYRELGRCYVEGSMEFIGSAAHKSGFNPSLTFVDKMPQNFMYIGLILLALPEARIIVTERGAMDTCLSNFKQLYNDPFYRFSYRLDEMGKYYIAYRRLMRHWSDVFGCRILEVSYEQLVDSPEAYAERIFDYCGLEWNREYLDCSRRDGFVATASATQVREAINSSSVGRWKKYERQLSPLLAQLTQAGLTGAVERAVK